MATAPGIYEYAGYELVARLKAALIDPATGLRGKWFDCGALESMQIDHQVTEVTDANTMTGIGNLYALSNPDGATLSISMKDWLDKNVAMGHASNVLEKVAVTIDAEERTVEAGEYVTWLRPANFTLVEKESGGSFAQAVLNVDYLVGDTGVTSLIAGKLRFTGTLPAVTSVQPMTTLGAKYSFLLEFRNKRQQMKRKTYLVHEATINPTSGTDLMAAGARLAITANIIAQLNVPEGESPFYSMDGEL